MSINKVDGSSVLRSQMVDKFQGTSKSEDQKKETPGIPADGTNGKASVRSDSLEISEAAHKLMNLQKAVDVGRTAMEATPDIREEKMDEVRQRLETGYYNSVEVRDKVASKVGNVIEELDKL